MSGPITMADGLRNVIIKMSRDSSQNVLDILATMANPYRVGYQSSDFCRTHRQSDISRNRESSEVIALIECWTPEVLKETTRELTGHGLCFSVSSGNFCELCCINSLVQTVKREAENEIETNVNRIEERKRKSPKRKSNGTVRSISTTSKSNATTAKKVRVEALTEPIVDSSAGIAGDEQATDMVDEPPSGTILYPARRVRLPNQRYRLAYDDPESGREFLFRFNNKKPNGLEYYICVGYRCRKLANVKDGFFSKDPTIGHSCGGVTIRDALIQANLV